MAACHFVGAVTITSGAEGTVSDAEGSLST
mgnify:CR=1 FL=1